MYHSITFGDGQNTRNTWTDWNLISESPPIIPSPKPKTNFIDIPGRIFGPIDASLIPFGDQSYERITGTWVFLLRDDYWHDADPRGTYESVRGWLHGRRTKIVLEDEPGKYFDGMFTVEAPKTDKGPFTLQIGFDLEPLRYLVSDDTIDPTWLHGIY